MLGLVVVVSVVVVVVLCWCGVVVVVRVSGVLAGVGERVGRPGARWGSGADLAGVA